MYDIVISFPIFDSSHSLHKNAKGKKMALLFGNLNTYSILFTNELPQISHIIHIIVIILSNNIMSILTTF